VIHEVGTDVRGGVVCVDDPDVEREIPVRARRLLRPCDGVAALHPRLADDVHDGIRREAVRHRDRSPSSVAKQYAA
jgi:hypothetical protein